MEVNEDNAMDVPITNFVRACSLEELKAKGWLGHESPVNSESPRYRSLNPRQSEPISRSAGTNRV